MSSPTEFGSSSPIQTIYEIPSTAPRLTLRKCIDKIAGFLELHEISWAGIELVPISKDGTLSPGTGPSAPAGKILRVYIFDPPDDPAEVSYLFQYSGFVKQQLPEGIEVVEFIGVDSTKPVKEERVR